MQIRKLRSSLSSLLVAACLGCLAAAQAQAAPVVVDFFGEITNVSGTAVGGPVQLGDPVSGRVVYEQSGGVDTVPSDPSIGLYSPTHIQSFDLTAGTYSVTANHLAQLGYIKVESRDDINLDGVSFRIGASGNDINGVSPYMMQFAPRDHNSPRILTHVNLPTIAELMLFEVLLPILGPGSTGNFLVFGGPGLDRFDYSVTSMVVSPEPGTAALLLAGLGLLAGRGRADRGRRNV